MSIRSRNKTKAAIASQNKHSVIIKRSNQHFYAQVVAPNGQVLAGASTKTPAVVKALGKIKSGNKAAAALLGQHVSEIIKKLKIEQVAFNRSGLVYHGRVAAFANGLRENGVLK
jgi:large subunit ribosomal protein L18